MQFLIYILIYPFLWLISILPFRLLYLFSDAIFYLLYYVVGYRKKVVRDNLILAFPEKEISEIKRIEKAFFQHMCDLFLEMIKSMTISEEEIKRRFAFRNLEILRKYEDQDKGIILVCGHYSSYEWMMSLGYHLKHKGFGIYLPITNKYFDRLVHRIRTRHNAGLIAAYGASNTIRKHKKEGILGVYGLASDQSPQLSRTRYWGKFFGIKVPMHIGAEKLAKELDYPILFIDIQKIKRGYYNTTFRLITDTPNNFPNYELTDTFTKMLETQIRKKPEYYLWTHKRFKHRDKAPND